MMCTMIIRFVYREDFRVHGLNWSKWPRLVSLGDSKEYVAVSNTTEQLCNIQFARGNGVEKRPGNPRTYDVFELVLPCQASQNHGVLKKPFVGKVWHPQHGNTIQQTLGNSPIFRLGQHLEGFSHIAHFHSTSRSLCFPSVVLLRVLACRGTPLNVFCFPPCSVDGVGQVEHGDDTDDHDEDEEEDEGDANCPVHPAFAVVHPHQPVPILRAEDRCHHQQI